MKETINTKVVKCTEGILFSYKMCQKLYARLYKTCSMINTDKSLVYEALEICWSIIDCMHRIREIIQQFPTMSTKEIFVRTFIDKTEITETYRNYIQHLRNELTKEEIDNFPVWGSLSWVDNDDISKSHTIVIGATIEKTSFHGCVFDTFEMKWVSKVVLSIKGLSYNFDILFHELEIFIKIFAEKLDEQEIKVSNTLTDPIILTCRIGKENA